MYQGRFRGNLFNARIAIFPFDSIAALSPNRFTPSTSQASRSKRYIPETRFNCSSYIHISYSVLLHASSWRVWSPCFISIHSLILYKHYLYHLGRLSNTYCIFTRSPKDLESPRRAERSVNDSSDALDIPYPVLSRHDARRPPRSSFLILSLFYPPLDRL